MPTFMHLWMWVSMAYFSSLKKNLSSRLSDKAPLNRAFLPPAEAAFVRVFIKQNLNPRLPLPLGGRSLAHQDKHFSSGDSPGGGKQDFLA